MTLATPRTPSRCRIAALLLAALTALAVFAIAGCASPAPSPSTDSPAPGGAPAEEPVTLRVASLKGPTSIGLASLIAESGGLAAADDPAATGPNQGGAAPAATGDVAASGESPAYAFTIAGTADEIVPALASGDVDIALIPANLAATLYQRTDGGIRVIDVNTLGVLYGLSGDESVRSMADLAGRTVYLTGKGTVPQYTLECLLDAAGVPPDALTLEYRSEPAEVVALLAADPSAVGIVPQPYATAALAQNETLRTVLDLTEEWDLLAARSDQSARVFGRLVTGVTVARAAVIDEHPQAVAAFVEAHRASAATAVNDPAAVAPTVVDLGIVGSAAVAERAIPQCSIVCLTGAEMQDALAGYLAMLEERAPQAIGGQLPDDDFYYLG